MASQKPLGSSDFKVLIIDDEISMAQYLSDLMVSNGHETTIFNDSQKALEHAKSKLDDYNLVLSDVCMPNMTGDCLAEEILSIKPDMPVILCSGYAPHVDKQKLLERGVMAFMEKPVNTSRLLQIVGDLSKC